MQLRNLLRKTLQCLRTIFSFLNRCSDILPPPNPPVTSILLLHVELPLVRCQGASVAECFAALPALMSIRLRIHLVFLLRGEQHRTTLRLVPYQVAAVAECLAVILALMSCSRCRCSRCRCSKSSRSSRSSRPTSTPTFARSSRCSSSLRGEQLRTTLLFVRCQPMRCAERNVAMLALIVSILRGAQRQTTLLRVVLCQAVAKAECLAAMHALLWFARSNLRGEQRQTALLLLVRCQVVAPAECLAAMLAMMSCKCAHSSWKWNDGSRCRCSSSRLTGSSSSTSTSSSSSRSSRWC